jgi:hypothetical protein
MVRFYPLSDGANQLPYSTGLTDATGAYQLTFADNKAGALVGRSRVVVYWPPRDRGSDGKPPPPDPSPVIPLRYTSVLDSPLTVEVNGGGKQTIDLPLVEDQ